MYDYEEKAEGVSFWVRVLTVVFLFSVIGTLFVYDDTPVVAVEVAK